MTTRPLDRVIHHLRRAVRPRGGGEWTDGELLSRFVATRDEAAFASLVGRHGPMVLGVCRRVLGNHHDAEDAFQATFLVLVRKAAGVVPRELVGNWLYGVAYRTALETKASRARRRAREAQVSARRDTQDLLDLAAEREQLGLLDRALARLPERYRAAVVLCDLEGKTHREAARLLGCPEKTLSTRLSRARKRLARRLAGAGSALAAVSGGASARAGVPAPLFHATCRVRALQLAPSPAVHPAEGPPCKLPYSCWRWRSTFPRPVKPKPSRLPAPRLSAPTMSPN
jgi:RNA polymerase sigma factor (sigma-70 family)